MTLVVSKLHWEVSRSKTVAALRATSVKSLRVPVLQFEFVRLRENGLRYVPEKSSNLEPDSFVPVEGTWTAEPIDAEWERVKVTEPVDLLDSRYFGWIRVLLE